MDRCECLFNDYTDIGIWCGYLFKDYIDKLHILIWISMRVYVRTVWISVFGELMRIWIGVSVFSKTTQISVSGVGIYLRTI